MKTAIDIIEGLCYKDRNSPLVGYHRPSQLIRHNTIAHHRACDAQAVGIVKVAWEDGASNIMDLLTNLMLAPCLRKRIVVTQHLADTPLIMLWKYEESNLKAKVVRQEFSNLCVAMTHLIQALCRSNGVKLISAY